MKIIGNKIDESLHTSSLTFYSIHFVLKNALFTMENSGGAAVGNVHKTSCPKCECIILSA